jgi:hypothetical protein
VLESAAADQGRFVPSKMASANIDRAVYDVQMLLAVGTPTHRPIAAHSVPRCSLRGRSGARQPRHASAQERAARGSAPPHPLRCAPRLRRGQIGGGEAGSLIEPKSWASPACCYEGPESERGTHPLWPAIPDQPQ